MGSVASNLVNLSLKLIVDKWTDIGTIGVGVEGLKRPPIESIYPLLIRI